MEPESAGNVGAIARLVNNFSFDEMVIVRPKCDIFSDEARARSMHAWGAIKKARVADSLKFLSRFDMVIGSTGVLAGNYSARRECVGAPELRKRLSGASGSIALLIGREGTGLSNDELSMCDIVVHIPTSRKYPVMNASHAAAIMMYELSAAGAGDSRIAKKDQTEAIFRFFNEIVDKSDMSKKGSVKLMFRNVIGRAAVREKEASALLGVFRNLKGH